MTDEPTTALAHVGRVTDQIRLLEANANAKEVASKVLARTAVPAIIALALIGVASGYWLPREGLIAVVGMVSTASMALIAMLASIVGTKESPEYSVINRLIERLDREEDPLVVEIEGNRVIVRRGPTEIASRRGEEGKP